MSLHPFAISQIHALKRKPQQEKAQDLLQKIHDQVLPILIARKWKVHRLQEFYPKNENLLGMNVNRGWKIMIRLRDPYDENHFYPYTEVLGTMLHELVHMKIGPHNASFFTVSIYEMILCNHEIIFILVIIGTKTRN